MKTIHVNTSSLERWANRLQQAEREIDEVRRKVRSLVSDMSGDVPSRYITRAKKYMNQLDKQADEVKQLAAGILRASELFEECERKLVGEAQGIESDPVEERIGSWDSGFGGFLDGILDALNIFEYARDYQDPGKQQEKARNEYLSQQISQIFDDPELCEDAWNKADLNGRKAIINEVMRRIDEIQGTDVKDSVRFFSKQPDSSGVITLGYYRNFFKDVSINTVAMQTRSYSGIMETVVHEMRHAYQHRVVSDPDGYVVSEETAKSWDKNFDRYVRYNEKKNNYTQYRTQPVEADAVSFARGVDYDYDA